MRIMIIKINKDVERARAILKLVEERESFVSTIDYEKFPTSATESYYEIIKELANALLLIEGLKTFGEYAHKELIDSLIKYEEFTEEDVFLINDLRIKRNNSSYNGKIIESIYLRNNKERLLKIIEKLKKTINERL